jgi:hypothetical protein
MQIDIAFVYARISPLSALLMRSVTAQNRVKTICPLNGASYDKCQEV